MAGLWLPRGFEKPLVGSRINQKHPLAAGLSVCVVLNEYGGEPFDLAGGLPVCQVVGTTTWISDGLGLAGAGCVTGGSYTGLDFTSAVTVVAKFRTSAFGTDQKIVAAWNDPSNYSMLLALNPVGELGWVVRSTTAATDVLVTTGRVPNDGASHLIAGQKTDAAFAAYIDGLVAGTRTGSADPVEPASTPLLLGSGGSAGGLQNPLIGTLEAVYVWARRALTDADHAQLAAEPYGFLTR